EAVVRDRDGEAPSGEREEGRERGEGDVGVAKLPREHELAQVPAQPVTLTARQRGVVDARVEAELGEVVLPEERRVGGGPGRDLEGQLAARVWVDERDRRSAA